MTSSAAGSAKASAASADASITLSGITQVANDRRGALAGRQLQLPDPLVYLARRNRGQFVRRLLDQIEQLALERSTIARRAGAQSLDHLVGHVLDRQAHSHDGSNIAPYWNQRQLVRNPHPVLERRRAVRRDRHGKRRGPCRRLCPL